MVSKTDYDQKLTKHGWDHIGSGAYANVYKKYGKNYILKVFDVDPCYATFVKKIIKLNNPYFPKVYGIGKIKNTTVHFVKLEMLNPITIRQWETDNIQEFIKFIKKDKSLTELKNKDKNFKEAVLLILDVIEQTNCEPDLHYHNIMQRNNGEYVMIDPISASISQVKIDLEDLEDHIRKDFYYIHNAHIPKEELIKAIYALIPEFKNDIRFFNIINSLVKKNELPNDIIKEYIKLNTDISAIWPLFQHTFGYTSPYRDILKTKSFDYFYEAVSKYDNLTDELLTYIDISKLNDEQIFDIVELYMKYQKLNLTHRFDLKKLYNNNKQHFDNIMKKNPLLKKTFKEIYNEL